MAVAARTVVLPPPLSSLPDASPEGMRRRLERLSSLLSSVNALAKRSGIPQSTIRKYFEKGTIPNTAMIALAGAAGVCPEWLLTGREPMWAEPVDENRGKTATDDVAYIPLYQLCASVRPGSSADDHVEVEDYLPFKRSWLRRHIAVNCDHLALLHVRGDSMEPTLRAEDLIMIDRSQDRVREGIYALLRDGELLVKRLQPGKSGKVKIVSENRSYDSIEIPASEIGERLQVFGRAVWMSRRTP